MYELVKKAATLVPYQPLKGDYAIRLDANENAFLDAPALNAIVLEALKDAPLSRYPDPYAAGVCGAFARHHGIDADTVTAFNGGDELLSVIASVLAARGGKLLTIEPDFSMYRFYAHLSELEHIALEKAADFTWRIEDAVKAANDEAADVIMFSNPCNPTGGCMDKAAVLGLVSSVKALVVVDEAYMDFAEDGMSVMDEVKNHDNLIVLRTTSKAMGLAGLRLGFAVCGDTLTRALRAAKSPYNVGVMTQRAGEAVLERTALLKAARESVLVERERLFTALSGFAGRGLRVFESCANFLFVKMDSPDKVYRALLDKGIAVRCFSNGLRITVGRREQNEALIRALGEIVG